MSKQDKPIRKRNPREEKARPTTPPPDKDSQTTRPGGNKPNPSGNKDNTPEEQNSG